MNTITLNELKQHSLNDIMVKFNHYIISDQVCKCGAELWITIVKSRYPQLSCRRFCGEKPIYFPRKWPPPPPKDLSTVLLDNGWYIFRDSALFRQVEQANIKSPDWIELVITFPSGRQQTLQVDQFDSIYSKRHQFYWESNGMFGGGSDWCTIEYWRPGYLNPIPS